jgi:hypothetical protein
LETLAGFVGNKRDFFEHFSLGTSPLPSACKPRAQNALSKKLELARSRQATPERLVSPTYLVEA